MSTVEPTTNTPTTTTAATTASPATATTASATKTKKPAAVKAITGFSSLSDANLVARAGAVVSGMTGNPAFNAPPVDITAFASAVNAYNAAISAALDGGKNAKAARNKQRKLVIRDLKLLAVYVENNCDDDMEVFTSSGFQAKSPVKTANQPVAIPTFRYVDFGANSGQLAVSIKKVNGARAYFARYAVITNGQLGAWTTLTIPNIQTATIVSGLTPGITYAFQVQALGPIGYSDWSDSMTIMCI